MESAINLHLHKDRNYLYFHDGLYSNLLFSWVVRHHYSWQNFIKHSYPHFHVTHNLTSEDLLKNNIYMISPLIQLTGCSQIIINADNCIPIIENEVGLNKISYTKAYLPIPDYRNVTPFHYNDGDNLIVAHFGIPNAFKHIGILIKAVELLRKNYNAKLLLAGYGIKTYVKNLPSSQQKFIIFEEAPSSERMLSLMKGADVTVQLRWPIMGQASGVVSEMLGLGLKCITTQGFVNECFKNYVIELPAYITPEQLAEAILNNRGNMTISPEEHKKLLNEFSYSASANLIFNQATSKLTNNKVIEENQSTNEIKINRKLRILYGASHRVLRYEEVRLFIEAGFEVIPVKAHWKIFKIQEPDSDNPAHPLYPNWRATCTVPDSIIEKIQAIDILKYQDLNAQGGKVSSAEAALLNEWIDIIYIPNLLPPVPRVLTWFKGLTLFRVYGEGKIMTYDEWAKTSGADLSVLRKYDARYATMLMLHALNGPEHASILGSNIFHVGPCVTKSRITSKWKVESASQICNIALSYIYENPHWTDMYHEFCHVFKDIPLRFLGKNNKEEHKILKQDNRVTGIIKNDYEYLELLTDCRCLLDPSTSPFHTHYTPLEAIMMGIPVIFLESSGMAGEILRAIPKSELKNSGICSNFMEAKKIIERCLDDIEYAKQISANQRIIAEKMFSPNTVLQQIKQFAAAAPTLVAKARTLPTSLDKIFSTIEMPMLGIENGATNVTSSRGEMALSQELLSVKFILKLAMKNIIRLSSNIIRRIYKIICPARFQPRTSEFLFKSFFPHKYANTGRLHHEINYLHANTNRLHHEINSLKSKISFSQAGEDRILLFICDYFIKESFIDLAYLDIGANDPEYDNNTYLIYLSGGKGVLVEPNSSWCEEIKKKRPRDIVLNMGISIDEKTKSGTYYMCDNHGLNTFSQERSATLQVDGHTITEIRDIPLINVNEVIKKYMNDKAPAFVSIDTEGFELGILKSINWGKYRPKIFCIESNMKSLKYGDFHPIIDFMEAKDYLYVANTSINMIFVSREVYYRSKSKEQEN